MKSGHYIATHKSLVTVYKLRVTEKMYRLYDNHTGIFVKTISLQNLNQWYDVVEKKQTRLYNIQYWSEGVLKETIVMNASYAVCVSRSQLMKRSTHKAGLLIIKETT